MKVGLVELYDKSVHGRSSWTSPDIDGQHIVIYSFDPVEFAEDPSDALLSLHGLTRARNHISVRPSLELIRITRLEGGEDVATILTSRITQVQRLWRERLLNTT